MSSVTPNVSPPTEGPLAYYWKRPVSELVTVTPPAFEPGARERHKIHALLLMALVRRWFNGNMLGAATGVYPRRGKQLLVMLPKDGAGVYAGGDYVGHNIAALAVDGDGAVIDFDFNHNEVFNSSVEHAESRLVRRLFALDRLADASRPPRPANAYSTLLSDVTIYTSLESCAQCSGIMTLANVGTIVYLQHDPGQYAIGNVMRNCTLMAQYRPDGPTPPPPKYAAPLPVSGDLIDGNPVGFEYYGLLNSAYTEYLAQMEAKKDPPFYVGRNGPVWARGITAFLCTDEAMAIYDRAAGDFTTLTLGYPDFKPTAAGTQALSNGDVLEHARDFYRYADTEGRRGTPHRV
jgi:tRNA(Arg) A34 adenosine deaminase TadA